MAGAFFNILIPTERHEIHLTQNSFCDCSSRNKHTINRKQLNTLENENKHKSNLLHTHLSMEKLLNAILSSLQIFNSIWAESRDHKNHSISFSIASNEHCEHILDLFMENGIGVKWNSTVVVLPCSLYYQGSGATQTLIESNQNKSSSDTTSVYESSWKTFIQSVRSRLTIAQVAQSLESGAKMVAALGLTQGETIIFVASMLLSPLMGPINAATFGTMIKDKKLRNMGIVNEIVGLVLCVIIGFGYGLTASYFDERDPSEWMTEEMVNMTDIKSLWVSIVLAFLTGIAVPIALLGNNTFSLVGVAISTSLLPPAVNAGLLWAFAVRNIGSTAVTANLQYSTILSVDFAIKGAMSMCLTFINIICIFACGIVILKIKAVTPKKSNNSRLINEYLKALKDINIGWQEDETHYLTLRLKEEYATVFGLSPNGLNLRRSCLTTGYNPFDLSFVTWSPGYNRQHNSQHINNLQRDMKSSQILKCKMNNFDIYKGNDSPGSFKAIFESPRENYSTIDSGDTYTSPIKRFVVTPATLENSSDA
ncbi:uncharacterized protein LOC126897051 isoform X2 [Daktulosphaira vitifoliae]|uniref:uncharacterized protein LOC126897051 isoform X2 n=1 Tax=Daktulosphaira vitifoliae TaxID=58002 RepID=UPI0021AA4A54|nr:uncharacterized protein LOC126897051 isoform X2 [Daktulosphaira vitifoliae]